MQSQNQNGGVQLSDRYLQYCFAKRHLRGESARKVFPFGQDGGTNTDIQQLNSPVHSNNRVYGADGISPTLNTMQGGLRQPFVKVPEATKQGYALAGVGDSINLSVPDSKTRRGRVGGGGIAQTLDTGMQQHTLTPEMKIRRLTPTECCRLQGFPDSWVDGISDSQKYKVLGNAVTVNVIRDVVSRMIA